MSLKNDYRRPVPDWLSEICLVEPEDLESYNFQLNKILQNSLFYPASGLDGRPVQFLAGFVHSFIYVDYGMERNTVVSALRDKGFSGYRLAGRKSLNEFDLAPAGWSPVIPSAYQPDIANFDRMRTGGFVKSGFADWYVFDREPHFGEDHGPARFSLIYICGDGVATYQAIYCRQKVAPEILAIVQPGTGFGGNYTDFRDPNGLLAWTVLSANGDRIPQYLVYGGLLLDYHQACWHAAYPEHVEWFQHVNGNGVWRRGVEHTSDQGDRPFPGVPA
jgi:hypothetical protein